MTDGDADAPPAETTDASEGEAAEQANEGDDQPAIEDDEMADLDAIAEEVQDETPAPDEGACDAAESDADDAESAERSADSEGITADGETVGDFYVGTLTSVSNAIIDEHGRDGAAKIDESLARQLQLDDAVDRLMADRGGPQLPPEQQLLFGTLVFALAVGAWKTDLVDQAISNLDFDL